MKLNTLSIKPIPVQISLYKYPLVSLLLLTTYVMTWDRDGGMLGYDGIVLKVGGLWDIYRM